MNDVSVIFTLDDQYYHLLAFKKEIFGKVTRHSMVKISQEEADKLLSK
jgi:hypothetical protein